MQELNACNYKNVSGGKSQKTDSPIIKGLNSGAGKRWILSSQTYHKTGHSIVYPRI